MKLAKHLMTAFRKATPLKKGVFFVVVAVFLSSIYFSYQNKDVLYGILGLLPLGGFFFFSKESASTPTSTHSAKKVAFGFDVSKFIAKIKSVFSIALAKLKNLRFPTPSQLKSVALSTLRALKNKISLKTGVIALLILSLSAVYACVVSFFVIFKNAQPYKNTFKFYFIDYAFSLKNGYLYILTPLIILFVGILGLFIFKKNKKEHFNKKHLALGIFRSVLMTFFVGLLGLVISMHISNVYAFVEIQQIASQIQSKKGLDKLGLFTDEKMMIEEMNKSTDLPKIFGESNDLRSKIVLATLNHNSKKSEFYQKKVLPRVAQKQKLGFTLPSDIFLTSDNTLVITKLNKEIIEKISPPLARIMVSKYFGDKYIKDNPKITLLNRQDYMKFREDQINDKIKEMDKLVKDAEATVNAYAARVASDKRQISYYRDLANQFERQKGSVYNDCKKIKYYDYWTGKYKSYYDDSYCRGLEKRWDSYIQQYRDTANYWEGVLRNDQYVLSQYIETRDLLVKYKEMVESQKDSTPNELGLFEPTDKIKVVLETVNNSAIADYFATLVHEYLHYSSYISKEKHLPIFFEEALTEYFSRKIVSNNLKTDTFLGYPIYIPIIQKMIEDIGEDKFERIYFTKDEKALQALLNEKYGSNFYGDSSYYFLALGYIQSRESLDIANNIMFKIGGKQLEEKDLFSKESNFNQSSSQK